jgi:hypothetical protein
MDVFARFSRLLGHFARGAVVQFFGFVIMWGNFEQPRIFNLDDLAHELLGGENQFVVYEPSRSIFGEATVGMNGDRLLVFYRLVITAFTEASSVIEKPGCYGLRRNTDKCNVVSSLTQLLQSSSR